MPDLRLVAVSEDGAHLVLRGEDGKKYTLPVDERLRAAVRGDRIRLGQIEIEMESQLRPRDIQARIRAGATAEEVAVAAGLSVVEGYTAMLLDSRQDAIAKVVEMAREAGADAVVGLRFDCSEITQSLSEVVAYGTAVKLAPAPEPAA